MNDSADPAKPAPETERDIIYGSGMLERTLRLWDCAFTIDAEHPPGSVVLRIQAEAHPEDDQLEVDRFFDISVDEMRSLSQFFAVAAEARERRNALHRAKQG